MRTHGARVALLAVALAAGCGGHSGAAQRVSLKVTAASGLADSPVAIDVRGLRPHGRATLRASWAAFGGHVWTSSVPLRASASRFAHHGLVYERAGHLIGLALPYQPAPTDQGAFGGHRARTPWPRQTCGRESCASSPASRATDQPS